MTITELIKKLQELKSIHGDLTIFDYNQDSSFYEDFRLEIVEWTKEEVEDIKYDYELKHFPNKAIVIYS